MDLRNLVTFMQVAELSSFTKAAEKLGYSQPTVSFQIKQLEQELNTQLFERIGHNVSLTDKGREVLSYAQRICQLSEEMNQSGKTDSEPQGLIHIGMPESLCGPLIIDHYAEFRQKFPKISLQVTTAGTGDLLQLLNHNEVDLICTMDQHLYDTNYQILTEEKICAHFVCSASHPLASFSSLSIEEMMNESFLLTEKGMSYRRIMDEQLAKLSLEILPVLELSNPVQLAQLVSEDKGISFLPDYVTKEYVKSGKLVQLNVQHFEIELWKQIVIHRDKWISRPLKAVIDHLSSKRLNYHKES